MENKRVAVLFARFLEVLFIGISKNNHFHLDKAKGFNFDHSPAHLLKTPFSRPCFSTNAQEQICRDPLEGLQTGGRKHPWSSAHST